MRVFSMGEVLWDVFDDQEILGGAPLNFCAAAQRLGNTAALLTAVGYDARGRRALEQIAKLNLPMEFIQAAGIRPTGAAVVVLDQQSNASFVIDRPAAFDRLEIDEALLVRIAAFEPDWVYFGTLAQAEPQNEAALNRVLARVPQAKRLYDINLRTGHWNLPLVQRLSAFADIIKLNETEASILSDLELGDAMTELHAFCSYWASTYDVGTICVTLGAEGCAIYRAGKLSRFPGYCVDVVDTVGAGDAFTAAFLHGVHAQWPLEQTAALANALGALVASRAGATPVWNIGECQSLIQGAGRN